MVSFLQDMVVQTCPKCSYQMDYSILLENSHFGVEYLGMHVAESSIFEDLGARVTFIKMTSEVVVVVRLCNDFLFVGRITRIEYTANCPQNFAELVILTYCP